MFRRILVPLDGSEISETVLPTVEKMLRREGATAVLVRAVDLPPTTNYTALRGIMIKLASEYLERKVRDLRRDEMEATARVVEDRAAEAILSVAEKEGCDLIAMSTHGRSGLPRFFLGSVAEKVLRNSPRPVLAVRAGPTPRPIPPKPFKNLLLPLDGSPEAAKIFEPALGLARLYSSKIVLLHVLEPIEEVPREIAADRDRDASLRLQEMLDGIRSKGGDAISFVRHGHPAEEIVRFVEENAIDLVCMTTHGASGVARWLLGSVAEKVLRHATVPVFLIRK